MKPVFSTKSLATLLVNFATSIGIVPNFGISYLSTSVFKSDKLLFKAKLLVSTCVIDSKSFLVATPSSLRSTVTCFIEDDSDKYFGMYLILYCVFSLSIYDFFVLYQLLLLHSLKQNYKYYHSLYDCNAKLNCLKYFLDLILLSRFYFLPLINKKRSLLSSVAL